MWEVFLESLQRPLQRNLSLEAVPFLPVCPPYFFPPLNSLLQRLPIALARRALWRVPIPGSWVLLAGALLSGRERFRPERPLLEDQAGVVSGWRSG